MMVMVAPPATGHHCAHQHDGKIAKSHLLPSLELQNQSAERDNTIFFPASNAPLSRLPAESDLTSYEIRTKRLLAWIMEGDLVCKKYPARARRGENRQSCGQSYWLGHISGGRIITYFRCCITLAFA